MSNKRVTKAVVPTVSLDKFEEALASYARHDAASLKLAAEQDVKINEVRAKYEPRFKEHMEQMEKDMEVLRAYCEQNKAELFVKSKTLFTVWGKLGFRTGNPKLKPLRGITWEMVLANLKKVLPKYVRKIEEPAKDLLMADRATKKVSENLQLVGLQVVQDETFFVEMNREDVPVKK